MNIEYMGKIYVTYIRVSTTKQGRSGLGLDAQRKMCEDFIAANNGTMTKEFVDVESGTHRDRKGLSDAIAYCKSSKCPLVIAKLDRLARDVEFCFSVVNTGIEIHFCDMPQMNTLLLGVFASVAQYERELTSDRTKKALAVKKEKGCRLGAASIKYMDSYNAKSDAVKSIESKKRGESKRLSHQRSKNVQAFLMVIRNVFPAATGDEEPSKWNWRLINTKNGAKERILHMMQDYRCLDNDLFSDWDFTIGERKLSMKLCGYMQNVKKSFLWV